MKEQMKYKIEFFDYWHLSSGLSAGARFDSVVVKDNDGFPFVSGKTIKGLLREMASDEEFLNECFGKIVEGGEESEDNQQGKCYFSDASLDNETAQAIRNNKNNNLQSNLYDVIASTKIDENGVAKDSSLREIEVVIPMTLYGEILNIPDKHKEEMKKCLSKVKRIGLNRNRGLGRCKIEVTGDKK